MIYLVDKKKLSYKRVPMYKLILIILIFLGLLLSSFYLILNKVNEKHKYERTEEELILLIDSKNEFSEDKFINLLKQYNLKFPHIALAQSKIETGYFKSKIFKESNNLFGMRQAKLRPTTSLGTQYEHSYYENWKKSVEDYCLWVAAYANRINKEEDFLNFLEHIYAEDSNYVNKIKKIVKKERLKEKFNE